MNPKFKTLQKQLQKKKSDLALFITQDADQYDPNLFYFTNYSGMGFLIVPKAKKPFIVVPEMEYEKAKNVSKVRPVKLKESFSQTIKKQLAKQNIKPQKIALDKTRITLAMHAALKKAFKASFIDVYETCKKIRIVKTPQEIKDIQKACTIADDIVIGTIAKFKTFKKESDVCAYLLYQTNKRGLTVSFPPIVASGKNASQPHYEPANTVLKKGFCVIDFGVIYNGYCSDMTRTIYLGTPTKKERDLYNHLLSAQQKTIAQLKENVKCSDLHAFAVNQLKPYHKYFVHALGHGVGVQIHESPSLSPNSKEKIENNMVLTIEPGIYIPNKCGMRIEDTILFTKKPKILTKTTKALIHVA